MNKILKALIVIGAILNLNLTAQDTEEVIVTSSFIDQNLSEISNPLHVVSGEEIRTSASESLGESIDDLLGISSADFGSAIGQPIIRGMSGTRVKVLDNGMVNRDFSTLGPDHPNDTDLNNVQQIEIVRGPSSLLYTNGGIGGIVNIVDNTIVIEFVLDPNASGECSDHGSSGLHSAGLHSIWVNHDSDIPGCFKRHA